MKNIIGNWILIGLVFNLFIFFEILVAPLRVNHVNNFVVQIICVTLQNNVTELVVFILSHIVQTANMCNTHFIYETKITIDY